MNEKTKRKSAIKRLGGQMLGVLRWLKSQWQTNPLPSILAVILLLLLAWTTWETGRLDNLGFGEKSYWDWMELLVIPVVLAVGAWWLNKSEREIEREIAKEKQNQATLEAYLDRMTELLLENELRESEENDEVRSVARTRTLATLRSLDGERKGQVVQFLYESGLIGPKLVTVLLNGADMSGASLSEADLHGADLRGANLHGADLSGADLGGFYLIRSWLDGATISDKWRLVRDNVTDGASGRDMWNENPRGANLRGANLRGANLRGANLSGANLRGANLRGADLSGAHLIWAQLYQTTLDDATIGDKWRLVRDIVTDGASGRDLRNEELSWADLSWADLSRADLSEANLSWADLSRADLSEANLHGADLSGANLSEANLREAKLGKTNLSEAKVTAEQLAQARSLKGAALPDGTKHD
jgi:uncharacterized protein YjbI with pentapeptide repeats